MFKFENSGLDKKDLEGFSEKIKKEIEKFEKAKGYDDSRGFVNLISDTEYLNNIKRVICEKQKLSPSLIVVIGIGGSNLGAQAVVEAVLGRKKSEEKILFADTTDPDDLNLTIEKIEKELKTGKNIILNVISKSGTTTETIVNFEVLLNILKKYKNPEKFIVITTDKNSKLWNYGEKNNFTLLEVPKNVGGRFSVFSAVGLFPLGMLNMNINKLVSGAREMTVKCFSMKISENPAAVNSCVIYNCIKSKKRIYDTFLFAKDLETLGKWYRQLLAESTGKTSKEGITPTVSIGTVDLHSIAQLYFAGPDDKLINFVKAGFNSDIKICDGKEFEFLVDDIQGLRLSEIMSAVYSGVVRAFKKQGKFFTETFLQDKSLFSIGAFLQWRMIETVFLSGLLKVNAFDQPDVESYKVETRRVLKRIKKD